MDISVFQASSHCKIDKLTGQPSGVHVLLGCSNLLPNLHHFTIVCWYCLHLVIEQTTERYDYYSSRGADDRGFSSIRSPSQQVSFFSAFFLALFYCCCYIVFGALALLYSWLIQLCFIHIRGIVKLLDRKW